MVTGAVLSSVEFVCTAAECSSACDFVTKLVELGFTSSAETFTFASDTYGMVPHKAICISVGLLAFYCLLYSLADKIGCPPLNIFCHVFQNDQMQEKVAADPVEEQEAGKLSSDNGSDDDYSQLQGSKGMLYKVESDIVDDEDVRIIGTVLLFFSIFLLRMYFDSN
jgi:hypothetical protein